MDIKQSMTIYNCMSAVGEQHSVERAETQMGIEAGAPEWALLLKGRAVGAASFFLNQRKKK